MSEGAIIARLDAVSEVPATMGRMANPLVELPDNAVLRKARGAFFTPPKVAEFITRWAVRKGSDRVLEPSCGEAAFLIEANNRLADLKAHSGDVSAITAEQLRGVELHPASARQAGALVREAGAAAEIVVGDFFLVEPEPVHDAVVGNPPYVRYQDFAGEARTRARTAALKSGVNLTALASSWAAFTIHSASFLRTGGRMGLVLPAELLSVNYAADVRRFLMQNFAEVNLVMFDERVFPGVLEEVVLLLADGYAMGSAEHASIFQMKSPDELGEVVDGHRWTPLPPESKWTASLMNRAALSAYTAASRDGAFATLEEWGDTTLGMVTGNNKFFALSPERFAELGLSRSDVVPLSPPGSKHLRGLALTNDAIRELGESGAATWLFRPAAEPSEAASAYIRAGHLAGVDTAYKCRVRTPWWRVPLVKPADLLLTYMNSDTPRITTNAAGAHHLNSVHGIYLTDQHRDLGTELLPIASVNTLTLLGAEVVGRAYGGGMLKLEPREADDLPVPSPALVLAAREGLLSVRDAVSRCLGSGDLLAAARTVDEVLTATGLYLDDAQLTTLRVARATLAARRGARGANPDRT